MTGINKSSEEKRFAERKSFEGTVVLEMDSRKVEGRSDTKLKAVGVDIGPGGLGVKTERAFQLGDILKIFLPMDEKDLVLPIFSEVRWSGQHNDHYRLGLQFLG